MKQQVPARTWKSIQIPELLNNREKDWGMNATAWDTWNIYAIPLQKSGVQRGLGGKAYGKTADGK